MTELADTPENFYNDEFNDDGFDWQVHKWLVIIEHELGHVFLSLEHGGRPECVDITRGNEAYLEEWSRPDFKSSSDVNGLVQMGLARNSTLTPNSTPEARLEVIVAGWCASLVFSKKDLKAAAKDDLDRARDLCDQIAITSGQPVEEVLANAEESAKRFLDARREQFQMAMEFAEGRLRLARDIISPDQFNFKVFEQEHLQEIQRQLGR